MTKRARFLAVALAASSLLAVAPGAQAEVRVGKNYRLNSDLNAFRGKDAVALAVNPSNPNHVVEVNNEYLTPNCEATRSTDGGNTWSAGAELPVPAGFFPACSLIGDHLAESMFQTIAFGTGNNVYAVYASRKVAGAQSVILGKSTDGGQTWGQATVALLEGAVNSPYYELPSVGVQPGAGTGGADRVYVTAHETTATGLSTAGDAAVTVSNDGGATFSAPVAAEGGTENATETSEPAIGANGDVYVAWRAVGTAGSVKIARSTNAGQTFGAPVEVATVNNAAASSPAYPTLPSSAPSSGSTFPRIRTSPTGNNVYIVYNQGPAAPGAPAGGFQGQDHFIPPDSDVYFQRSQNNGATWSTPKLINDATSRPGNESPASPASFGKVTQTRHPYLSIAPNGRIDIVWQDRRHWYRGCIHTHQLCEEARLGDTYLSSSSDNGSNFSANHRISDRSHNNDVGYDYRFGTGWAFGPVAAPMGNNGLIVGWMDSRNGGYENDLQDIYLAKVDMNGGAAVPTESVARTDNVATSVRLEQHTYPGGGEGLLASTFATRPGTRVVIVNETDYSSALAAGVLARANLSTVLLTPPGGLPASVKAEVARMKPAGAYMVGGNGTLSNQIQTDLTNAGVPAGQVERISGPNAAELAARIARNLDRRRDAQKAAGDPPAFNAVAVVNPASPDAAAVAGLAAARRLPILFTNKDSIPAATTDVIDDLDVDKALVIGGTQWISNAVMSQLPAAQRLGGADQYATSKAVVAESVSRGLPTNLAYLADGQRPMDGALLGPVAGRVTALTALSKFPLTSTAAGTATGLGLSSQLDRMILLQGSQVIAPSGPNYQLPRPGTLPAFSGCPAGSINVILGTNGNDNRTGTTAGDRMFLGTGNDVADGLPGDDCIDLGPGNDRGQGGLGTDLIMAGTGNDRASGSSGNDRIRGNAGRDRLDGGRGNDRIFGDSGNDRLLGSFGNDRLHGVSGRDVISGSRGRDNINGGASGDRISGGSSGDRISGDAGGDRINGNSGADRIRGNSGNDRITSLDNQRDRVNCGSGRDSVLADREDIVSGNCERVRRR